MDKFRDDDFEADRNAPNTTSRRNRELTSVFPNILFKF